MDCVSRRARLSLVPQFDASAGVTSTSTATLLSFDALTLPGSSATFGQLSLLTNPVFADSMSAGSGSLQVTADGNKYELVWRHLWSAAYCLLSVTLVSEIQAPIENQIEKIDREGDVIFLNLVMIAVICAFFVIPCIWRMSITISRPMKKTCQQSQQIVDNIGGNLFKGVDLQHKDGPTHWTEKPDWLTSIFFHDPGEVIALRGEFSKMLYNLTRKRVKQSQPPSPFYNMASQHPPSAPMMSVAHSPEYMAVASAIQAPKSREVLAAEEKELSPPWSQPLTFWNQLQTQISVKLLAPMLIAMVLIVVISSVRMTAAVERWMGPIGDAMRTEELQSLEIRTHERAEYVGAVFKAAVGSLTAYHGFAQELVDGRVLSSAPQVCDCL